MNSLHQRIAAVAVALAGFAVVQLLGGSGFVATFIAGALMSALVRPQERRLYEFAEAEGHSLVLVAFLIFGMGPGARLFESGFRVEAAVVAILSVAVLRPVGMAVSLMGERLSGRTIVFLGWFGPRGLASVVFVLVAIEELTSIDRMVQDTVTVTVMLSILVHGLSAAPMSRWLTHMAMTEDMPEMGEAYAHPTRR